MLNKTNLVLVAAPLPADFNGTPQELYQAMLERMEIQSPIGSNFFVVGDVEPSSNQGPWLKGGSQWYIFDQTDKRYVPIDISQSETLPFTISPNAPGAPTGDAPLVWLRTSGTRMIGWYAWDGTSWRASDSLPASGPTASRPTTPVDLERFWDTDINTLIHYERGSWRTLSGTPGDIKFVALGLLADALRYNPGWQYIGKDDQSVRGLALAIATKDTGATPVTSFATDSGISARAAGAKVGAEAIVLDNDEIPQHSHLIGHSTLLNSDNNIQLHRVGDSETIAIPPVVPPNYFEVKGEGSTNGTKLGTAGTGPAGTMLLTSRQIDTAAYTGAAVAHENLPPTVYFWCLVKT